MENSEWDFMAVYYDAIDHFGHGFMNYHPPQQDHVSDKDFEIYKGVVEAGYRYHDMMLERLIELAGEDTTVILVSDHGFHSDHLRPQSLSKAPAAPAAQHSPYGIFCASGPNIKKDELVFGSTLLDITPTILDLFGLPVGKDMVGKPILQIYENPEKPDYIQSWENIAGECGMHTYEAIRDPWAEQEALDQLIALGYIDPPGENVKEHIDKSVRESKFYLARVHLDSKKLDKALSILEEIYRQTPEETRYALYLMKCYLGLNRPEDGLKIMDDVKKLIPETTPQMNLMTGKLLLLKNDLDGALEYLEKAEQQDAENFAIYLDLGHIYLRKKILDKAETSFLKTIKINKDSAMGHFGLGQVLQKKNHLQRAAEEFLTAVGLLYFFPNAHYFLGEALFKLKYYEQAEAAFKTAVSQAPGMEKAHLYLIDIYTNILNEPEKVEIHQGIIREKILPQKLKRGTE
ncbi:MAG: tetratricopeptide repeat protein [Desulfobacterium sp.]|nr:tetratricopeptide repeat protein [Desulfobacterium sp.]